MTEPEMTAAEMIAHLLRCSVPLFRLREIDCSRCRNVLPLAAVEAEDIERWLMTADGSAVCPGCVAPSDRGDDAATWPAVALLAFVQIHLDSLRDVAEDGLDGELRQAAEDLLLAARRFTLAACNDGAPPHISLGFVDVAGELGRLIGSQPSGEIRL